METRKLIRQLVIEVLNEMPNQSVMHSNPTETFTNTANVHHNHHEETLRQDDFDDAGDDMIADAIFDEIMALIKDLPPEEADEMLAAAQDMLTRD